MDNNEKKDTNFKVLLCVIIAVVLLGGIGIYYFGLKDKKDDKLVPLDMNSDIVNDLVYPRYLTWFRDFEWDYKDVNISGYSTAQRMSFAATLFIEGFENLESGVYEQSNVRWIPETDLEANFRKIFGPDAEYKNGNLFEGKLKCFSIDVYVTDKKAYPFTDGCETTDDEMGVLKSLQKVEQEGDYIYTYFNVLRYIDDKSLILVDEDNGVFDISGIYIVRSDDSMTKVDSIDDVQKAFTNGDADIYKFTFKKQSDGKYYIHAGHWEK